MAELGVRGRRGLPGLEYPERYLQELTTDLSHRFAGVFNVETIERYVLESYTALLRTSSVKAHLSMQVTRFATERLTALAQSKGAWSHDVPEVLFVCEQNAGRSQMAAVLLNSLAEGRVHVRSAGSTPAGAIGPEAIAALRELGLDFDEEFPKPLTDDVVRAADVVITMGCGDSCPIFPGKRYEDWELVDPAGKDIETVRAVRDDIKARIQNLLGELLPA